MDIQEQGYVIPFGDGPYPIYERRVGKSVIQNMLAGVKIYEYEPGFIHAKSYLVDDNQAMIGTINLDYRSLVHHFENGVWMYGCESTKNLKADIEDTLNKSIEIANHMLKTNLLQRFIRAIVRVIAPML